MNVKFKSVCKIDSAGRIVIPAPLRKMLKIAADEGIIINKECNE